MKHTFFRPLLLVALLVGFSISCSDQKNFEPSTPGNRQSARVAADDRPDFTIVRGQYIILSANNSLPSDLESQVLKANGRLSGLMNEVGIATASSNDPNFAAKMAKVKGIQSVVPEVSAQWVKPEVTFEMEEGFEPATATNPATNTFFPFQWGHKAIHAPEAWAAGYQGEGVKVAVLDEGFHLTHPDLAGNIIYSKSFVPGESAQFALPGFSHGTHTAGTVAALDNDRGVIGVAPKAKLVLIKVLRDTGSGAFSWLLKGIMEAVAQKVDIISMSLGAYLPRNGKFLDDNGTPNDPSDDFIVNDTKAIQELLTIQTRVINYASQQGITIIAAAGNSAINGNQDKSGIHIPSGLPNVLSISATGPIGWASNPATNLDLLASYSNYGTPDVSFAAPGGDFQLPGNAPCTVAGLTIPCWAFDMVLSTSSNTPSIASYSWSAGTSMATPHVAGVAALIIGKNGGPMRPDRVEAALRASADDLGAPGRDPMYGMGRVNAAKAVGVSY